MTRLRPGNIDLNNFKSCSEWSDLSTNQDTGLFGCDSASASFLTASRVDAESSVCALARIKLSEDCSHLEPNNSKGRLPGDSRPRSVSQLWYTSFVKTKRPFWSMRTYRLPPSSYSASTTLSLPPACCPVVCPPWPASPAVAPAVL